MINPEQTQPQAPTATIPEHIDAEFLAMNQKSMYFCQILIATVGGSVAGILGFSGIPGFIFYIFVHLVFCSLYNLKDKNLQQYFISPKTMWYDSISSGLMSLV
ncbi:transmembrane protein [Heterostelium album PN500]|uniref:ER membrane protein complex subunit 6 n=1 Tax=Heterostelium pallidum (strain ATCC 26659 / Pp 5 / PN500) TaxID=670386 RepID=D3B1M8_HETP5|nr:transmembrane protein [Heterostelium album PN500]EFA85202.1 transmembrane protein [Heterostelium album PN500]|eukprot:XP_020437311.1 transmembrane protein [Heterostelium album PN500]